MGKTKYKLLASSPTIDGLLSMVTRYYYGSSIRFEGPDVYNANGKIDNVRVTQEKLNGRWRFERQAD